MYMSELLLVRLHKEAVLHMWLSPAPCLLHNKHCAYSQALQSAERS